MHDQPKTVHDYRQRPWDMCVVYVDSIRQRFEIVYLQHRKFQENLHLLCNSEKSVSPVG